MKSESVNDKIDTNVFLCAGRTIYHGIGDDVYSYIEMVIGPSNFLLQPYPSKVEKQKEEAAV